MDEAALAELGARALVVGVSSGGRVELAAHGVAGPDTVFYAASITKQLVGYLAAEAVLSGALAPEDRIVDRLPDLPDELGPVRIGHLLHHTGDLPDVARGPDRPHHNVELVDRLRRAASGRRVEPGRRFAYSNTGYVLLAEVLARATGRPFAQLAHERILLPLDMTRSRLGGPASPIDGEEDPPGTVGDGGLWTTVPELLRWLDALQSGELEPAAVRLMESVTGFAAPGSNYAWGVVVTATADGPRITHGGTWGSGLGKTVRLPRHGVSAAVLAIGADETAVSDLGARVAELAARRPEG